MGISSWELKQSHEREDNTSRRQAGIYAHANQFKRKRTTLGPMPCEARRKMGSLAHENRAMLDTCVQRAERIHCHRPEDKSKLNALHAPAECIGTGKARQPCEFGWKVSLTVPHHHRLMVCARSLLGPLTAVRRWLSTTPQFSPPG